MVSETGDLADIVTECEAVIKRLEVENKELKRRDLDLRKQVMLLVIRSASPPISLEVERAMLKSMEASDE